MLSKYFGEAGSSLATSRLGGPVSTATSPEQGLLLPRPHMTEATRVGMGNWGRNWGRKGSSMSLWGWTG